MTEKFYKPSCVACTAVDRWAEKRGVKFDAAYDVTRNPEAMSRAQEIAERYGKFDMPLIIRDGELVSSGFSPDKLQVLVN